MTNALFAQVQEVAADIFDVPLEQIGGESSPQTIASWDSLQHLNLVLALEDKFETEFAPEEIEQMLKIEAIVRLVREKTLGAGVRR
jgi:acyl carrier protein